MDFDKNEIIAIVGLGIVGILVFMIAAREESAPEGANPQLWDTAAYHLPNIRTGFIKHYPLNHDYWWCDAQNEDTSLTGLSRWGKDYS